LTSEEFTALCDTVSGRSLGSAGQAIGAAMATVFPADQINTDLRIAHFMAQTAEETGGYRWLVELGGPDYFAKYDGRADLGNSQPGDGYLFRGRGLIMLTGRANYEKYGPLVNLDLIGNPDLAADPAKAVAIAGAYWSALGLNGLADADDVIEITRRINGGLNGLIVRQAYLGTAKAYLAAHPAPAPAFDIPPLPAPNPSPMFPPTQMPPIPLTPSVPQLPPAFTPAPVASTPPTLTTVATPARVGSSVALTGLVAGATAMAQIHIVDLKGLIDAGFVYLVSPIVLGIVVGLATSVARLLNVNMQSAAAQSILTAAENGAAALVSKAQTAADTHGEVVTKNDMIAGTLNYINTSFPDAIKASGLATPAGQAHLANLAEAKVAQATAAIQPPKAPTA
jgi:putative chitinase